MLVRAAETGTTITATTAPDSRSDKQTVETLDDKKDYYPLLQQYLNNINITVVA